MYTYAVNNFNQSKRHFFGAEWTACLSNKTNIKFLIVMSAVAASAGEILAQFQYSVGSPDNFRFDKTTQWCFFNAITQEWQHSTIVLKHCQKPLNMAYTSNYDVSSVYIISDLPLHGFCTVLRDVIYLHLAAVNALLICSGTMANDLLLLGFFFMSETYIWRWPNLKGPFPLSSHLWAQNFNINVVDDVIFLWSAFRARESCNK